MEKVNSELESYFRKISRSLKETDDLVRVEITLTKDQLINPLLKQCLEQGYFDKIKKNCYIDFICKDGDLFFDENETKLLLENYQAIVGEMTIEEIIKNRRIVRDQLFFEETIFGKMHTESPKGKLIESYPETKSVKRRFSEIIEINKKLSTIAEKINNLPEQLSPFEKYLLCHKVASNIEFFYNGGVNESSQSFVDTVKTNKGCCVGKAQYLRALLYMVGIKACDIKIFDHRLDLAKLKDYVKNGRDGSITIESTGETYTFEKGTEVLIKQFSRNDTKHRLNHEINLVELNDENYDIHGIFAADNHSKGCINNCYIPLEGNIDTIFNFSSFYSSAEDVCKFLDKLDTKENKKLGEKQADKIYKEYYKIGERLSKSDGEDILYNDHNHSIKTMQAIESRIRLEEAPLAGSIPFKVLEKAQAKIDKIYKNYFTEKNHEKEPVL